MAKKHSGLTGADLHNPKGIDALNTSTALVMSQSAQTISVSGSVLPNATNTYDLGSASKMWKDIYVSSGSIQFVDPSTNLVVSTIGLDADGNQNISGSVLPDADATYDLGSSTKEWNNLYIDGTANIDSLTLTSGATVTTVLDEDGMGTNSATALSTQQSIKAYVDAQVTAQDFDATTDSGTIDIDLDSETLTVAGGAGIDTSASGTTITIAGEAASLTNAGIVEIATAAETNTGTDATRAVSPDALEDWEGSAQVTTLGTISSGTWEGTTVAVDQGGTGATSLADLITLTTHTSGNYVKKVTVGTGLGGAVDSEGGTAAMTLDAAQTQITSLLATDIKIGEDDQTKIDFETADTIHFYAGNENQLVLTDGALTPASNAIVDLGTDALEFKDAFFDGTVEADAITIGGTALNTVIAGVTVSNATLAATVTITDKSDSVNYDILFGNSTSAVYDDTGTFTYNPGTSTLVVPNINVSGTQTFVDTATLVVTSSVIFEGATDDGFETTLTVVDPTDDRTWTLQNATDTIVGLATSDTLTNKTLTSPTITGTGAIAGTFTGDITGDVTGNADTSTKIASITNSNIVQLTSSQTLTNKTLTSPTLTGPILGTPASGTMTNVNGTSGITGLGTQSQDLEMGGQNIQTVGVITLKEQAEADADVAGEGQLWVDTATPNVLYFTDDAGTDFRLSYTNTGTGNNVLATSPTIVTPTIASFANSTHTHANAAGGGQITLGTGTTGNYVATAVAGTGISVSGATGNVTISSAITAGDGLTLNTADIDIDASQTTLTSILNSALVTGRDSDNQIKYSTDDNIIFRVAGGDGVTFKASGEIEATSLDIEGDADINGTLEADAITVDSVALNEYIADTVGAMVGSNTETNITVTYEDSDNTLDFVIGTLNQDTSGTADNITVSANNSSDETVYPIFVDGATGSQGAESDTGLTYNPSSGILTGTQFTGNVTGNVTGNTSGTAATVTTAAQPAITSLGTLTTLAIDNITIDGNTISSTAGTDLNITPLTGQQIVLDGAIVVDAGVVTGATSITSTAFVGDVTGDVTGNADTATALASGVTIGMTGDVVWTSPSFDGSGNVTAAATIQATSVDNSMLAGSIANSKLSNSTISGVSLGSNLNSLSVTANGGIGMTSYNGSAAVSNLALDIDGMTDIGAAIVDADLIVLDDGAGGTNRKATMSRLKSYMGDISGGSTLGNVQVGVTAAGEIDTSSGNLTIDSAGGTTTIDDAVIISGDLTVSGTTTTINTTNLNVDDNIIELNAGTSDGGIYVKETQGGAATGSMLWDVSENRWFAGVAGSEKNVVLIDSTDTLTNKTLTTPVIGSFTNATHTHANSAGGGQITLGTGTTGNYVSTAVAGSGIDVSAATGDVTISIGTAEVTDAMLNDDVATGLAGAGTTATSGVVNVIGGNGITANTNDVAITAAQTTITSIYAEDLIIGEDSQTAIDFGTANEIDFKINNSTELTLDASALYPVTDAGLDLGTSDLEFKDAFFDGTVTSDAFAGPLTGNVTGQASTVATITGLAPDTATTQATQGAITSAANLVTVGTIGSGEWAATDVAVTHGGTGASSAGDARTNLGVAIGSDVQAYDAQLASVAGWSAAQVTTLGNIGTTTTAADKMIYTTAADTFAETAITSFGRSILDDANESTFKATVNLEIGTDVQAYDAQLADLAGLAVTDSSFIVGDGSNFVLESASTSRTSLGLGTSAVLSTAAIANGGTGVATADQIHTFVTTQTDAMDADTSGKATTAGTADLATTVTVTDSNTTANYDVPFNNAGALLEDDGAFYYNPGTGTLRVPNLSVAGTTTQVDTVTMNAQNAVIFEGSTADDFETTLTITDPTADRTITLQNATGTLAFTSDITGTNSNTNTGDQLVFKTVVSDSGTATADTITDALSILGGTGISTAVSGDTLTITGHAVYTDAEAVSAVSSADDYLKNDANDTTSGNLTVGGITIGGHSVDDIDITSEATDADDHLMTALAIKNRIEDYNYSTTTGTVTNVATAGTVSGLTLTGGAITSTGTITLGGTLTLGDLDTGGNAATATTAGISTTSTVADTTDTSCYVGLWESATGNLGAKSDAGLTYNAGTGMLTATGFTGPLTGQAATVATIAGLAPNTATTQATQGAITSAANLVTVGTIGTGVWNGDKVASAYLDDDTAHLSTTQTFSGAKTFSSSITLGGHAVDDIDITSEASDADDHLMTAAAIKARIDDLKGVTSNVAGTAISVSGATGAVTITNTGVTSIVAGTGIDVSGATGAVTVSTEQDIDTGADVTFNDFRADSIGVGMAATSTSGQLDAAADIVAFSSSDKRWKENLIRISDPLEKIGKISGYEFDWKELTEEERKTQHSQTGHDIGVIAQEIQEVLPEVVKERDNGYLAVKYEKIVPLLIEAIKEQQKQIDELRKSKMNKRIRE